MQVYNGQVAKGVDHEALMPAAWRLDRYLDADVDGDEDISLASLRGHRLTYDKSQQRDDMARNDNVDDLKVMILGAFLESPAFIWWNRLALLLLAAQVSA